MRNAPSLPTLVGALEALNGPAPALVALDRTLDYAALRAAARGVATWLVQNGVSPGARVAIVQRDGPWAAVMLLGASYAHAALPLNPNLSAEDYAFAITDFDVAAVLVEQGALDRTRLDAVTAPILSFTPWSIHATGTDTPVPAFADAPAFLLHTSGTTARPKKVVLTQERIFRSANVIASALQLGAADRCLTGMPMFHVHGILNALASTLVSGGSFVHSGPFDTLAFYTHLRALEPTWITAVPTMYHAIGARAELVPPDRKLRFLRSSSAPLSDVLAERLGRLFAVPVVSSYGMTEIDPIACVSVGETPPPGAVGRPAGLDVRLAGPGGEEVSGDAMGEVWVRGARVIAAYEAETEINQAAFSDGWFRTGDLARRDDAGWLYLAGRIKEIINRAGEKIAPLEIDAVLLRHPEVIEAAAFGTPDAVLGEDIAAAVVLQPGSTLAEHELRAWLAERLAFHKCPRNLHFVSALPKGPTGKLLRGALSRTPVPAAPQDDTGGDIGGDGRTGDVALVCAVWAEVLGLGDVAPDANFLDLGGSSTAALDILDRLSERLGRDLPVDVLFDSDTPIAFTAALRRLNGKPTRAAPA
ncbi:MAG: non-ribosomal peptide synthetase [Reyranella sp.]|nr:non-ribosomal peptide synthetase [Reyranella sp.]